MRIPVCFFSGFAFLLSSAQVVFAAPLVSDLQHAWLYDAVDQNGYVADEAGDVRMTSMRILSTPENPGSRQVVPLVEEGTMVSVGRPDHVQSGFFGNHDTQRPLPAGVTPFDYVGNKSVLNDWYIATIRADYPDDKRVALAVTEDIVGSPVTLAASGSVSMWVNALRHDVSWEGFTTPAAPTETYMLGFMGPTASDRFHVGLDPGGFAAVEMERSDGSYQATYVDFGADDPGFYGWGLSDPNVELPYNGFPTSKWTNIVVAWGPDGMQIYIDGVAREESTSAATFTMGPDFNATRIMLSRYNNDRPIPILLDELAIWDTQLTQSDAMWLTHNSLSTLFLVPEPGSAYLMLVGLVGLAAWRRNRKQ